MLWDDLLANAVVIDDAIRFVAVNKDWKEKRENKGLVENIAYNESLTTNQIFR